MNNITLYLMSKKGYEVLNSIIENNLHNFIHMVVFANDKNVIKDYAAEIELLCSTKKIKCYNRRKCPNNYADFAILISWRWLIPVGQSQKIIVLHDSLLPKYRGFAPLVNALINKEKKIGVTALFASKEYDKGDVIMQEYININYPIKIEHAIEMITKCYKNIVLDLLNKVKLNINIRGTIQSEYDATYSLWRDEKDYEIDWNTTSSYLERFINATGYPYKGASSNLDGRKIRIFDVEAKEDVNIENRTPGKVIFMVEEKPVVVCGKGLLKIENAIYDDSGESIFPVNKFRLRLGK
ncbi:MAG: formyltransferase family protein [Maribacter sp.]